MRNRTVERVPGQFVTFICAFEKRYGLNNIAGLALLVLVGNQTRRKIKVVCSPGEVHNKGAKERIVEFTMSL